MDKNLIPFKQFKLSLEFALGVVFISLVQFEIREKPRSLPG